MRDAGALGREVRSREDILLTGVGAGGALEGYVPRRSTTSHRPLTMGQWPIVKKIVTKLQTAFLALLFLASH